MELGFELNSWAMESSRTCIHVKRVIVDTIQDLG
jgi:hypothetical protein